MKTMRNTLMAMMAALAFGMGGQATAGGKEYQPLGWEYTMFILESGGRPTNCYRKEDKSISDLCFDIDLGETLSRMDKEGWEPVSFDFYTFERGMQRAQYHVLARRKKK